MLRATNDNEGVIYFAFLLDGGDSSEWEIDPILRQALGDDAAASNAAIWDEMVSGDQKGTTFLAADLSERLLVRGPADRPPWA